jgi:integrase
MANKQTLLVGEKALATIDPQGQAERIFDLLDVSQTTRDDYKSRIDLFLMFVSKQGLNRDSFLGYKRYLRDRTDYTIATKNKYLATAKVFLRELARQGLLPDITLNIKTFSQNKKHKRDGINDQEMTLLVDKISHLKDTPQNTRLKAIISLLALQGLRQVEITRLDISDLDLAGKRAFIQGKGRDDKEPVDLHPETIKTLKLYLKSNKISSGALFVSRSNNHRNQRLTTRAIRGLVKGILNKLGIEKTTHGFRHYFTTRLIRTYKGDLLEVAQYTRHKGLEMLQVYNDSIKRQADLPRYYGAFKGLDFS